MRRSLSDRVLSVLVLLPFGAAITYLHLAKGVASDFFIYGSGSWGFGCILKMVLYHGIIGRLRHESSGMLKVSALNGLFSGVTELGVALVFFALLPPLSFWELVAFGVGVGSIEALLVATSQDVFKGTSLEPASRDFEAVLSRLTGSRRLVYGHLLPFAERLIAGVIHVGTRGLVYVTRHTLHPMPLLLAMAAFFLVDGVLGYRLFSEGKLNDLGVLNRLMAGVALIGTLVLAAFLLYWPAVAGIAPAAT